MRRCTADFKVGGRVRSSIETAKLSSLKLSYVKQVNTDEDAYIVKSSPTSSEGSNEQIVFTPGSLIDAL